VTLRAARHLTPQVRFVALAVLINLAASGMAQSVSDPAKRGVVSVAAAFDMTITVTALYYWMIVRPGLRPARSLAFIALLGVLRASFVFPQLLPNRALLGVVAELAVIGLVVFGFRRVRALRGEDPVERLQCILSEIIPAPAAARAVAGELSVLWYAFAWRARPSVPAGAQAFTLHQNSGFSDLFLFVGLASLLEIVPVHLVAAHWSFIAAWILTGLSLYGAVWAFALSRSFGLRPTLVSADAVVVRYGLLFSVRIPLSSIRALGSDPVPGAFILPRNTTPTLFLDFHEPLEAEKIFGFTKQIHSLGLSPDDAPALRDAIQTAIQRLG